MSNETGFSRRRFLAKGGAVLGAAALAQIVPASPLGLTGLRTSLPLAEAAPTVLIQLDPANPTNLTQEGTQASRPGVVLTLQDATVADFIAFYAPLGLAQGLPGTTIDVVATFQVGSFVPAGVDGDNWLVINDGQSHAAVANCVVMGGVRGIGLVAGGDATLPATYPVFLPVDWEAAPTTVRLRRWSNGDAEIVEINGVVPSPRALLAAAQQRGPTRVGFTTAEFGCSSLEGMCTVQYSALRAEIPDTGTADAPLTITRIDAAADRNGDAAAGITFTDADPQGNLSQYSGTINWGDGTVASHLSIVRNPFGGGFAAGGVHRYASDGTFAVAIIVNDAGGANVTKSSTLKVKRGR